MTSLSLHNVAIAMFATSTFVITYTYLLYPLMAGVLARFGRAWTQAAPQGFVVRVSVIMAARNEESRIGTRVREILTHLDQLDLKGELLVVSDGSTDHTVARIQEIIDPRLRLIELPQNQGKSYAISRAAAQATGEILVFCDVRQRWETGALTQLLSNFVDLQVGAASGDLVLDPSQGALQAVGFYWRMEKWIRQRESQWHSCVGVTGAMCAVRQELFCEVPQGTILDDVYWPLRVSLQGFRVVHDPNARSFDCLPPHSGDEFQRKIRTLSGNYQLLFRLPQVFRPWNNPVLFPFVSHKLMRLVAPWALLCLALSCVLLGGPLFTTLFVVQLVAYAVACIGLCVPRACGVRMVSIASAFLLLNTACWLSFFVWLSGAAASSWKPVSYEPPA